MSWKSTVIAGLLCVLAVPAFALEANPITAKLLGLDTAGNWVWEISVDPDQTTFTNPVEVLPATDRGNGGSVAIELGISAPDRGVVSAAKNATNFPSDDKGNAPAGWGANIDGAGTNPDEGVAFNPTTDRVVAYLGSQFFGTLNGATDGAGTWTNLTNGDLKAAFRVHTERPTSTALTTTLDFLGAANANGTLGGALPLFAENGTQVGVAVASAVGSVRPGNAKLEPTIGSASFALLLASYEVTPGAANKTWQKGDFNGDLHTNSSDFAILLANYNGVDPYWTANGAGSTTLATSPGAGAGAGGAGVAVPEPTSLVLLALGGMIAALRSRKR